MGLLVLFSYIFLFGVKSDFSNSSVLGFLHPMKLHVCIYVGGFMLRNIVRYHPLARQSAETAFLKNNFFHAQKMLNKKLHDVLSPPYVCLALYEILEQTEAL